MSAGRSGKEDSGGGGLRAKKGSLREKKSFWAKINPGTKKKSSRAKNPTGAKIKIPRRAKIKSPLQGKKNRANKNPLG